MDAELKRSDLLRRKKKKLVQDFLSLFFYPPEGKVKGKCFIYNL